MPRDKDKEPIEEESEEEAESASLDHSNTTQAKRTTIHFPKWNANEQDSWPPFAMKVKSYVSRLGYGDLIKVANNKMELGSDKDLLQANYQCFHDLVLNVTRGDALRVLSSCEEETFTSAWMKLIKESGTTTSIRCSALVREITHIGIQQFTNMQSYSTKCGQGGAHHSWYIILFSIVHRRYYGYPLV